MRLRREDIPKLSEKILKNLLDNNVISSQEATAKLVEKIQSTLFNHLAEEDALEKQVEKVMEQYKTQIASGTIDPQKMYMMIKKQVAKERKFVL